MINQTAGPIINNADIFYIREKMITDILMKHNIEKIRSRPIHIYSSNSQSRDKTKKIKNKHKTHSKKTSELILPSILAKNSITSKNNKNNQVISINEKDDTISSCGKYLFSSENEQKEYLIKRFLESKKRNNIIRLVKIEKENENLFKKLQNVGSSLNRDSFNSSYEKYCEYKKIAKKAKTNKEIQARTDKSVRYRLPPIIVNQNNTNLIKKPASIINFDKSNQISNTCKNSVGNGVSFINKIKEFLNI